MSILVNKNTRVITHAVTPATAGAQTLACSYCTADDKILSSLGPGLRRGDVKG